MKRAIFITTFVAVLLSVAAAQAQENYSYTVTRTYTRTLKINWKPESKEFQRYTVAVNPLHVFNNGFKFDFEYELPRPGSWLQTSIIGYVAPPIERSAYWYGSDGNNRWSFNSGFDDFHKMWGVGTSLLYKWMFHRRGWYLSTGLVLEYFRVGNMVPGYYVPYEEDGLTFYQRGLLLETSSFFKPTAQFNIGKHFALSRRCFFDLFAGMGISYSFHKRDGREYDGDYHHYDYKYSDMYGFAYRGLNAFNMGFRFGVLLWDRK